MDDFNRDVDINDLEQAAVIGGNDAGGGASARSTPITIPFTIITTIWLSLSASAQYKCVK